MFVFATPLVLSLLLSVQAEDVSKLNAIKTQDAINPKEFVELGGRNYYISSPENRITPLEAQIFCNDIGMELVSLETEGEDSLIRNFLIDTGRSRSVYWTSGKSVDGQFHWSGSGQPFTYTNWRNGEPDFEEPETTVLLFYADDWIDRENDVRSAFICEQQP